jgi:glycosyltransferase involved in cell wall biosynthesis
MNSYNCVKTFHLAMETGNLDYANQIVNKMRLNNYPSALVESLNVLLKNAKDNDTSCPLVSVVIPIYDREDILRDAITSILTQTYSNFEVILVADGSPEGTLNVIREFESNHKVKVFYFPKSSGNAVRARNKAILESSGKYISFLDSDDVATSNRLELSVNALEEFGCDVVYGDWLAIIDGTREISNIVHNEIISSSEYDFELLRSDCIPCQSTVTIRKSIISKAGFIKPKLEYREDHEFWLRLAYFGAKFFKIPKVLVNLRLHDGNNELNFKANDDIFIDMVQQEFCIRGHIPKKIVFILPSVGISGGIGVVFKHADMLLQRGHDVTILNIGHRNNGDWFPNRQTPIIHVDDINDYSLKNIDLLFATEWSTVSFLDKIPSNRKLYFVQSDERRFHEDPELISLVHSTYNKDIEYLTEAHWIRHMLRTEFQKDSYYVPNGLDSKIFYKCEPLKEKENTRKRVLLEGPICIPFKGMADCYAAVEGLDCEIWIVSSAGRPPSDWKYDCFFEAVPFMEMRKLYSSCDIFIKMSRVEGFFGPPLEAMACGCSVVVGKVTGYDEYIIDEFNALVVEQGDVLGARYAVEKLLNNEDLRLSLIDNGYKTSKKWTWEQSSRCMLEIVRG